MIKFSCGECGKVFRISDQYAGKHVRCKGCNRVNTIPWPQDEALGKGDSVAMYNALLRELAKAEESAPTVEIET